MVELKRIFTYALQFSLGLMIIAAIFCFININSFIESLKQTKFVFVFLAMLTYFIAMCLGLIRPQVIFKHLGKRIGWGKLLSSSFAAMLASDVTPGRTGYFSLPFLIKKDVPVETSFSTIITMQVIDFLIKIVSTIVCLWIISQTTKLSAAILYATLIGIIAVMVFASLFILALWSKRTLSLFRLFTKIPFIGKFIANFEDKIETFQTEAHLIKKILPQIILLSAIGWITKGIEWYFLGLAVGFNFPFWFYLFLQPMITIVQFVPLTPAGLGLQEGGSIFVLVILGASVESALLFSFLGRIILIIVDMIGIPELLKHGIGVFEGAKT